MTDPDDVEDGLSALIGDEAVASYKAQVLKHSEALLVDDPLLPFAIELLTDLRQEQPAKIIDVAALVRKKVKGQEAGYAGWPDVKRLRDLMGQLVAELDEWDRREHRPGQGS